MNTKSISDYISFIDKQNISENCKQRCKNIIYTVYSDNNMIILYGGNIFPPMISIINKLCEYDLSHENEYKLFDNYMEAVNYGNLFLFCKPKDNTPIKWDIEYATKGTPFYKDTCFTNNFISTFYSDLDSSLWLSSTPREMVDMLLERFGQTIMRGRQISWK